MSIPTSLTHILRLYNTNLHGTHPIHFSLTQIRGIGRRIATAICRKARVDPNTRAGVLSQEDIESLVNVINNLGQYLPAYMLNHKNHLVANNLDADFRLFIENGKKIKNIRVLRLCNGLKVRGQRTKSNGRGGNAMGVLRKK